MKQIIKLYLSTYHCRTLKLKIFFHHHPCLCIPPLIFNKSPRQNSLQEILEKDFDQFDQGL